MPETLENRAIHVGEGIARASPAITGVCLYGSVARGDAGPDSDLDFLVVGDDPKLTPSQIRKKLRVAEPKHRVSIVYHTPRTIERYLATGSRFLLHLQLEGRVIYDSDGTLRRVKSHPLIEHPAEEEIAGQLKRLRLYTDLERYNGNFLFPLSHIYSIAKAIVMAVLAENSVYEFNRDEAFRAFSVRFPDATGDVETVARLRPFYRLVSRGIREDLPFSYHDCDQEVRKAVDAVRALAAQSLHDG